MFIGHFAVGFASKALVPRVSLVPLLIAPLFLDMLWPILISLGIEKVRITPGWTAVSPLELYHYPWSHSLVMTLLWSALAAFAGWAWLRNIKAAGVLAMGVFSHWVLDFVTHRPDMPLVPGGSTFLGLGLWNSRVGTAIVEGGFWVVSVILYLRATRPVNRTGTYALAALVGLLSVMYAGSLSGQPPPSVKAVVIFAFVSWLFFVWAWVADKNRVAAEDAPRAVDAPRAAV